jgi:capsular exopolysaccharide synthesis family protein
MGVELPVGLSDAQTISGTTKGLGHVIAELEEVRSDRVVDRLQERFDQITARCMDRDGAAPVTLAICSANAREGTTTVSVGMASAAQRLLGRDVVLVETNTIAPMLATEFHVSRFPGLSEYLSGEADLEQVVRRTRQNGLWLVSAGGKVDTPGPLIRSDRFPQILDALRRIYSVIILDVPPLLSSPHAALIARRADGVVLVSRAGRTHAKDIERAARAVEGVQVRGLVLNRTKRWLPRWLSGIAGFPDSSVE